MITFSSEAAKYATKFVNSTNCHVFLTGKAGTGKTTFLKYIVEHSHKNTIVAAPTGIAAINAGGVTLHSLFQLPFGAFLPSNQIDFDREVSIQLTTPRTLLQNRQMNKTKRAMLQELELLIIDEVSMLRADLLDAIDVILQSIRRNRRPFGGVQILFIGDLWQLPPVVKDDEWRYLSRFYSSIFFFEALALKETKPLFLELDKIYRQSDMRFINLLNNLRDSKITSSDIEILNHHYKPDFVPKKNEGYIKLNTHNYQADDLNRQALKSLPGKSFYFDAEIEGEFKEYQFPVDASLELKKDAQVMFIKNDYSGERRYFNGKIGIISNISDDSIEVEFNDDTPATTVDPYTWENKRYTLNKETNQIEEKLLGTFSHYPLKLAWAITVHKSQGLTFERAIIDVSRAFASGQVYVALSRLTSLDGLVLTAPIPTTGLQPGNSLKEFAKTRQESDQLDKVFETESRRFISGFILMTFNFSYLIQQFGYHLDTYNKDEQRSVKQQHRAWASEIQSDLFKLKEVSDKFLKQLKGILESQEPGYVNFLHERLKAAKEFFEPKLKEFSERIFTQIRALKSEKRIKKYLNELRDVELLFFKQLHLIYKSEALIKASIEKKELSKQELEKTALYSTRGEVLNKGLAKMSSGKKEKPLKKVGAKKEDKIDTKEITYTFFKAGLSIEEIA
ncbi:MAG: AAA family ATPase, partial [Bacteroidota bacterium]|nr:AAA family ATPase [Bacteroidota bacterium]